MTKDYGTIEFKNYQIGPLLEFMNISLPNQAARARNRMIIFFGEPMKKVEEARQALLTKYCQLDEKKERVIGENGLYKLTDQAGFDKEYEELTHTIASFPITPSNKMDVDMVKDLILNLETKLSVKDTTVYNEICEVFEKI